MGRGADAEGIRASLTGNRIKIFKEKEKAKAVPELKKVEVPASLPGSLGESSR